MKRTVLVICIQCAMMTHVTSHAKARNSQSNVINQMIANEQSLRKQQNELTTQLNELQTYTKAQNKNYDAAIESLIAQNDQLITLNQSMMAEIEKLNRDMAQLQTTANANKKHILSLTQATTKKVKEIQTFLDKQEAEFNSIINKGKLMGLLGLLGLLSALLWAYFLNRKQHSKTQKLKTEIERILNQIQENSDNTMVTWSEQQTDTLNMWQKNFKSEMQDLIQHNIKTATTEHIASIKEAANATIEAENAKVASIAAEKAAQENQASDSLNLSQFARSDTAETQVPAASHTQHTAQDEAALQTNIHDTAMQENAFPSDETLHQLEGVMMSQQADASTSGVNRPVADISPASSKEQPSSSISQNLASDDVLAELDAVSAELANADAADLPAQSLSTADVAEVDIDGIDIDDLNATLGADDAIDIDEIDALNQLDQMASTDHASVAENQMPSDNHIDDIANALDSLYQPENAAENPADEAKTTHEANNDIVQNDVLETTVNEAVNNTINETMDDTVAHNELADEDINALLESAISEDGSMAATDEISLEDMLADDLLSDGDVFGDSMVETNTFNDTITNQTIIEPAINESDPALTLDDSMDNIDNLAQAMQAIDTDDTLVVETPAVITGKLAPAQTPKASSTETANAPAQYDAQKAANTSQSTSKPVAADADTAPNPSSLYEQGKQFESQNNLSDALYAYNTLIDTYEFDENTQNMKLVASALDKKAKLLLSKNKVRDAIETYDRIISRYDDVQENYAKNLVSEAVLNSTLLELVYTNSIKGSKVGTARTVFKDSPENLLAVEMLEMLRLAVRKDVSTALEPLTLRFEGTSLINMDWQALENWATSLNDRAKPRVLDTISFFKGWNESLAV